MIKKEKNQKQEDENNPFRDENFQEESQEVENNEESTVEVEEETKEATTESANKELEDLRNQYIRLAADFDNYRKRQAQERESLLKYGAEDTLKKILPVLDTFVRAKEALNNTDDIEQAKESIDVVEKQLVDSLDKIGLKKIETNGVEFDPNLHEAVMQTPTNDHPDHSIIAELQSGYILDDRVIRAALVNVAVND